MTFDNTAGPGGTEAAREHDPSGIPTSRLLAWPDTALNRLGLHSRFARDCLLAVLTTLISAGLLWALLGIVAPAAGIVVPPAAAAALTILTCAQSLVLCVRRRTPLLCFSAVVSAQVGIIAFLPTDASFQGLPPFIAAYTCGTLLPLRRLPWVLAGATIIQTACGLLLSSAPFIPVPSSTSAFDPLTAGTALLLSTLFGYALMVFIGSHVATRRDFIRLMQLRATEALETQRERTNGAIQAERTRMARELHDIAAHHLSGMVVQASAAERLVGKDEGAARETMAWIRSQGKETLHNLRLVVGALRESGEHTHETGGTLHHNSEPQIDGAPIPGMGVIDGLVEDERALGTAINLVRSGEPYDLPPVADVTFYRVAQEALSNAREHAWGAQVRVLLHHGESETMLQVENRPGTKPRAEPEKAPPSPRGLGLVGMKERARLIGAILDAGPPESGGWRVRLTLPFTRKFAASGADASAEG